MLKNKHQIKYVLIFTLRRLEPKAKLICLIAVLSFVCTQRASVSKLKSFTSGISKQAIPISREILVQQLQLESKSEESE